MQTQAMGCGARTGTTTKLERAMVERDDGRGFALGGGARDEAGDRKRAADETPAEGVRVDRAIERDQEDGVAVDARAEVGEGGGDGGSVAGGDRLPKRKVGDQHARGVGELASARRRGCGSARAHRHRSSSVTRLPEVPPPRDVDGGQRRGHEQDEGAHHQGEQPRLETAAAHRGYFFPIWKVRLCCSLAPRLTGCGRGSLRIPAYHTRTSYVPSGRSGKLRASARRHGEVGRVDHHDVRAHLVVDVASDRDHSRLVEDDRPLGRARVQRELEPLRRREGVDLVPDVVAVGKDHRRAGLDRQDVGHEHAILLVEHRAARSAAAAAWPRGRHTPPRRRPRLPGRLRTSTTRSSRRRRGWRWQAAGKRRSDASAPSITVVAARWRPAGGGPATSAA